MINKIKNYIIAITAFISTALAIFGVYVWNAKIKKQSDLNKTNKDIEANDKKINYAETKIEKVVEEKSKVVCNIAAKEKKIDELKQEIKEVSPKEITDVVEAKENIIKKTRRRGRRPNKNNNQDVSK